MPVGALYLSLAETCFYINFLIGLIELFINAEFPIGSACMHFLSFFFEKFAVNFLTLATHLILKETINGCNNYQPTGWDKVVSSFHCFLSSRDSLPEPVSVNKLTCSNCAFCWFGKPGRFSLTYRKDRII